MAFEVLKLQAYPTVWLADKDVTGKMGRGRLRKGGIAVHEDQQTALHQARRGKAQGAPCLTHIYTEHIWLPD